MWRVCDIRSYDTLQNEKLRKKKLTVSVPNSTNVSNSNNNLFPIEVYKNL